MPTASISPDSGSNGRKRIETSDAAHGKDDPTKTKKRRRDQERHDIQAIAAQLDNRLRRLGLTTSWNQRHSALVVIAELVSAFSVLSRIFRFRQMTVGDERLTWFDESCR